MEGRRDPLADSQLAALDRLLEQASTQDDPRVRSDAIEAVAQRTVYVCTIPGTQPPEPRVLVNSKGEVGLPLYTRLTNLEEAARLYGWANPDGHVEHLEMGARHAFQFARDRSIHAVVVDCGLDHAIELTPAEWPQAAPARRPSSSSGQSLRSSSTVGIRPPAVASASPSSHPPPPTSPSSPGTISAAAASDAMRESGGGLGLRPASPQAADVPARTGSNVAAAGPQLTQSGMGYPAVGSAGAPLPSTTTRAIAVGGAMSIEVAGRALSITRPRVAPSDAQKDALADVLRNYPEVEWASFLAIAPADAEPEVGVGLRIDSALRKRLPEIETALRDAGGKAGIAGSVPVVSLDRPDVMRFVRSAGIPFFPWKK